MGLWDSLGGLLGQGANALGKGVGAIGGGLSSLFNSFGSGASSGYGGGGLSQNAKQMYGASGAGSWGQSQLGGGGNSNFGGMFGGGMGKLGGLGTIFGSQLIGNPKIPQLPQSFQNFQAQANAGGPPIQQQSQQYLQTLLSGQNTAANDAATYSLDRGYEQEIRDLNSVYHNARPGSEFINDTTYKRDKALIDDRYQRARAQTLAQQQMGAAQQGVQAGAEQANQQAAAIQTQVEQIAQQWNMSAQQRAALRNMLMELGGLQVGGSQFGLANLFKGFGGN